MSYTYEKVSSNKAKLVFTVAADVFEAEIQKAYLKNRGRMNIPGFRKGKAPRKLIESMYGKAVFYDDALDAVFGAEYEPAVEAEKLQVVDQPSVTEINWAEIEEGKDVVITCEVFVRPDVVLGDYKALTVEVASEKVTDEAIDARIKQDQEKASRVVDVDDRNVQDGDTVNLNYAGTVDGVAFEGGTAENQTLKIGSGMFIPGFEEQMVGMAIGEEKDLTVKFPEQYHAAELAGKDAVFHVKVNGIQMTEVPALDDEFAADISEFDTFAEYRAAIVKELEERTAKNNEISVENALVEKAVENATVEIPAPMVETQLNYMMREMEMQMAYQGIRMEDYLKYTGMTVEQVRGMQRAEAEKRVKVELVLEAIRKVENVEPTDEEVAKQTADQAERMGQAVEEFEKTLTEAQRSYLRDTAAIQKVVDLLKVDATVNEKAAESAETPADAE